MIVETNFSWRGVALYCGLGALLAVLQSVLGRYSDWAVPEVTLVLVIHAGFFRGAHEAGWIALALGALVDAQSGTYFGYTMTLYMIVLIATRILLGRVFSDTPAFQGAAVFGLSAVCAVAGWALLALFTDAAPAAGGYFRLAPLRSLSAAIAAVPLSVALSRLYSVRFFSLGKRGLQT